MKFPGTQKQRGKNKSLSLHLEVALAKANLLAFSNPFPFSMAKLTYWSKLSLFM